MIRSLRVKPVLAHRHVNQLLAKPAATPVEVVRTLLAMQAQEYWGGLWAVGLRTRGATESDVEEALARGDILRSHPMRGTHHFVSKEDLGWLIALMGPVMIRRSAHRNRQLELDEKTLAKAMRVLQKALEGGTHLTRDAARDALERGGVNADGQRLMHIIYRAELEAVACSGERQGKQITLALFDERVPSSRSRPREEALAELARRYFATRAPATIDDFAWWCQLPMADVRGAIELAGVDVDAPRPAPEAELPRALALPPYDEYAVAYRDRSALGAAPKTATHFGATTLLGPLLILDGQVAGLWRRKGKTPVLEPWRKLSKADAALLRQAAERWTSFSSAAGDAAAEAGNRKDLRLLKQLVELQGT